MTAVIRGVGDIGSAVAHALYLDGLSVVIHDDPKPTTTRRGMSFADAVFDGRATLDGVEALRARDIDGVRNLLASRRAIPVYVRPLDRLLKATAPAVLVDARMRKHPEPEVLGNPRRMNPARRAPGESSGELHHGRGVRDRWRTRDLVAFEALAALSLPPRSTISDPSGDHVNR